MSIVFYTSGHGFGHAARDVEVINELGRLAPAVRVVIRSAAPRWLFDRTLTTPVELHSVQCDTGVIQIDSLTLDAEETIRRADAFHAELPARAEEEAAFLHRAGTRVVLGDIPPLAFAAAARAGVPAIALGNFTWDWIYAAYEEPLRRAPLLLERIREAYSTAAEAWRLPFPGGFGPFRSVVDLPFIARHSRRSRADVRSLLGLPQNRTLVLASFGGYGVRDVDWSAAANASGCIIAIATDGSPDMPAVREISPGLFEIAEGPLYAAGLRYEDLVAAADVVATKPGYGIISECIANGAAMLYTSRGHFAEYDVMVAQMPQYLRCEYIDRDDLAQGRWTAPLDRLLAQTGPAHAPATNGAAIAAARLMEYL